MYGTQTDIIGTFYNYTFENDVKMYGTQTATSVAKEMIAFENDVNLHNSAIQSLSSAMRYVVLNMKNLTIQKGSRELCRELDLV